MEKALSRNEIVRRARAFVPRWADATYEKGQSQIFWNEFLTVFGIDQKRVKASFEHATKRASTGKTGFIDLFWPGVLLVEQKSAGRDLEKAEFQARDYLPELSDSELPRALIMSDFREIRIVRLDTDDQEPQVLRTADLPEEIDRFSFLTHERDVAVRAEEEANAKAVALMGNLYAELVESGFGGHEASVFMVRTLFLLFGDDTGLWRSGLFEEFIRERTAVDGSDCGSQMGMLFQTLDRALEARSANLDYVLTQFPYVNGGLFAERVDAPAFTALMRESLLACCAFDWAKISPAIFGSMFQTVKPQVERREAGEHYTTEENILKTLRPLFLDELDDAFHKCGSELSKIQAFHESLAKLRLFDPACGCGNFLLIAYRELRALELDVLRKIKAITGQAPLPIDITQTLRISPEQFYGIEISEWPAEIAKTAFFMIDHQANKQLAAEFGAAPDRLPITLTANIHVGNALQMDWNEVCPASSDVTIFGNPPFIGQYSKNAQQTADTKAVWGSRYNGYLDYVTCWYAKALDYYLDERGKWAFVSTNSICQGEATKPLWTPILEAGWRCRFAHRSFRWNSEASGKAAVHVSIIGFDRVKKNPRPMLWEYPEGGEGDAMPREVTRVNPYLVDGPNVLIDSFTKPLSEVLPPVTNGSKPVDGGGLVVEPADYLEVSADPIAGKYLRPYIGARELLHDEKRWCLWLEGITGAEIQKSPVLQRRLEQVRSFRAASTKALTREGAKTPYLFQQIRQPSVPYLCIPSVVSENRLFFTAGYEQPDVITSNLAYMTPDPDAFLLALLSSTMFVTWMRTIGGRLESRLRFSGSYTYNSFPMPQIADSQRKSVSELGQMLVAARAESPERSLADLYDPRAMPAEILKVHANLDRVVDRLFLSANADVTTASRQRALFRHYAKLTDVPDWQLGT